ncbi:hypothetical protein EST38_g3816 [Candolleomyces aberdarensis]|uniref:DUF6533 domain-containing protein n=1 Tax=Candolleomyces aberdarensis TaxID=2316362 RepID=A0A4Q2DPS9_9AGAR|nr:hypothetical protein EST38_g3816 [Candolleomyces aberdarensis]
MSSSVDANLVAIYKVCDYIAVSAQTICGCDYLGTLTEEVALIWPEKWGLGKILFLITRYSLLLKIVTYSLVGLPMSQKLPLKACDDLWIATNVLTLIVTYSSTGTMLVCLYALLGPNLIRFYVFTGAYLGFFITTIVLMSNDLRWTAYEEGDTLAFAYGYSCSVSPSRPIFVQVSNWTIFAREAAMFLLSAFVLIARWRKVGGSVSKVVRRDGGILYLTACSISLLRVIFLTPGFPVQDYTVLAWARAVLCPMLANRLLINLRKAASERELQDSRSGTVSSVIFTPVIENAHSDEFWALDDEQPSDSKLT